MLLFGFGEWYPGLVFLFTLSFDWCRAVTMDVCNALVSTVGNGVGVILEVNVRIFEYAEIMRFTRSKVCRDDLSRGLDYD
jgi:hypothetical protein